MSILDEIKKILLQGPNDWSARLAKTVKFISPDGNEFEAYWRGDARNMRKKLGIYDYPKVSGSIVKSFGSESARYPLTIYFEGKNNDIEARRFFAAAKEDGLWDVTHPVHGFLGLELVSITENNQPVESGNITEINTEWIEPIDEISLKTARELAGIMDSKLDDLNLSAAEQFANIVNDATETLKASIEFSTNTVNNLTDAILGPLFTSVDALDNSVNAVQDGIQDTLNAVVLKPLTLAGQIQQLIQLPLLANNDVNARVDYYTDLAEAFFELLTDENDERARNETAVHELALSAALGAMSKIITTGPLSTRAQAVDLVDKISAYFFNITNNLDDVMDNFDTKDIDQQYFSQSQSFVEAATLTGLGIDYLLISAFDLKIEKRIILETYRAPIEITITEYGSLGDEEANLDLFYSSNNLYGDRMLLLPPGHEVLIYV